VRVLGIVLAMENTDGFTFVLGSRHHSQRNKNSREEKVKSRELHGWGREWIGSTDGDETNELNRWEWFEIARKQINELKKNARKTGRKSRNRERERERFEESGDEKKQDMWSVGDVLTTHGPAANPFPLRIVYLLEATKVLRG
jgi:hypothetical protein